MMVELFINVGKTINHLPVITIFIGGIYKPFPVMAALWHCFSHINGYEREMVHTWIIMNPIKIHFFNTIKYVMDIPLESH